MRNDNILEKAKRLGLDTGNSSNHLDNLRTVANQLGVDFDSLNNLNELEAILDNHLLQEQENENEYLNENNNENSAEIQNQSSSQNEHRNGQNRKPVGQEEYKKAIGEDGKYDKDYYKNRGEELDKKVEAAKEEKARTVKKADPNDPNPFDPDAPNNIQKNWKDKLNDNKDLTKAKYDRIKNKMDGAKAKYYEKAHPIKAFENRTAKKIEHGVKDVGKKAASGIKNLGKASGVKKAGKTLANGVKKIGNWFSRKALSGLLIAGKYFISFKTIIITAIVFLFVFIFLLVLFQGGAGDAEAGAGSFGYFDPAYDFNQTIVVYTNEAGETTELSISDYVKGVVYNLTKDGNYTDEQIKAMMVVVKTNVLSEGNYSNQTMKVTASNTYTYEDYTEMSEKLDSLYLEIENELYLPNIYSGGITSLTPSTSLELTPEVFLEQTGNYNEILDNVYNTDGSLEIYDLADHVDYYTVTNNGGGDDFWWPIGSSETQNINGKKFATGKPAHLVITSKYGWRESTDSYHYGVDIGGDRNANIIASKSGTVVGVKDQYGRGACDPDYKYSANYVIIEHDDGSKTKYWHLEKGTITVKYGDRVEQGQVIGGMGNSGYSCGVHLHFEILINGSNVNPADYISANNPRPVTEFKIKYVDARVNKQKVCKTLLASGFSEPATIAMMINIQEESTFNPNAIGDSGTSYGLCQWHLDRWDNLKKHRPNDWETISGQLEYLVYELKSVPRFARVYKSIVSSSDAKAISQEWCYYFEVPDKRDSVCPARTNNNITHMTAYVQNGCQ